MKSAAGGAGGVGAAADAESLEARVAAFRADPQLMEVATRFVAEVLERAKEEASRRLRERDGAAPQEAAASDVARGRGRGLRGRSARWGSRAQNFLVRIFATLCLCNTGGGGGGGGEATVAAAAVAAAAASSKGS